MYYFEKLYLYILKNNELNSFIDILKQKKTL